MTQACKKKGLLGLEIVNLCCEVGPEPMTAAAQVESAFSEAARQSCVGTTGGVVPITAENAHVETDSQTVEELNQPKGRNRRAEQSSRSSQKAKNRKRIAQGNVGVTSTDAAVGAKSRGAVETSYEVTHDPDPLCRTVAGVDNQRSLQFNLWNLSRQFCGYCF